MRLGDERVETSAKHPQLGVRCQGSFTLSLFLLLLLTVTVCRDREITLVSLRRSRDMITNTCLEIENSCQLTKRWYFLLLRTWYIFAAPDTNKPKIGLFNSLITLCKSLWKLYWWKNDGQFSRPVHAVLEALVLGFKRCKATCYVVHAMTWCQQMSLFYPYLNPQLCPLS